ncbi:cytochrome P450 2J2-like [Haemaphysalis longicornis]
MERRSGSFASNFSVENLINAAVGYFVAGSQAVPAYLHWHVLNCALHPVTVQAKLQEEIDRVIGPDIEPTWEHRRRMPFTMAVIWEMLRWKLVAPLSAPRRAGVDFEHEGFFFPSGINVMANIWAVHNDPYVWSHPEKFDPGRFMNEDGSAICYMPEQLITFSVGA